MPVADQRVRRRVWHGVQRFGLTVSSVFKYTVIRGVDISSDGSLGALHSFNFHPIPAQLKMLFTNFSSLLPLLQFFPFGSAAEQKLLKDGKSSPFDKKFEKLVYETLELWHVPGVAIGVVDGDLEWSEVSI